MRSQALAAASTDPLCSGWELMQHFSYLTAEAFPWALAPCPGCSEVKNPTTNARDAGDAGSVPVWGRSREWGHGNPLQYSCLGNPRDRGAWPTGSQTVRHGWTHTHTHTHRAPCQVSEGAVSPPCSFCFSFCLCPDPSVKKKWHIQSWSYGEGSRVEELNICGFHLLSGSHTSHRHSAQGPPSLLTLSTSAILLPSF